MSGTSRPRVVLLETIHPESLRWLSQRAEVSIAPDLADDTLGPLLALAQGLVIRAHGRVDEPLLNAAPHLRVVGRHGVGLDNVDLEACTRRGIWVVHTPLAGVEAVAEHAVALMLAVARHVLAGDRAVREGTFDQARMALESRDLVGRTLGVVGFGRIGQRTAEICRAAFHMAVLFADELPQEEAAARLGARRVPLRELLASSDVVSLHLPLTPATHRIIDAAALGAMQPGTILINTSRGGVIDQEALVRALREGRVAAGLDVFEEEPLPAGHPLAGLRSVVLTPHNASHSEGALMAMARVVEDVVRVLEGEIPLFPANAPQAATGGRARVRPA